MQILGLRYYLDDKVPFKMETNSKPAKVWTPIKASPCLIVCRLSEKYRPVGVKLRARPKDLRNGHDMLVTDLQALTNVMWSPLLNFQCSKCPYVPSAPRPIRIADAVPR